jgi:hypothetical protein
MENTPRTYSVTATGRRTGESHTVVGQWPNQRAARAEAGPDCRHRVNCDGRWGGQATTVTVERVA